MVDKTSCQVSTVGISSPIGNYLVIACSEGLHSVNLSHEVTNNNFRDLGQDEVTLVSGVIPKANRVLADAVKWMKVFFGPGDKKNLPHVPICPEFLDKNTTDFRRKVLVTLKDKIGFGQTVSYGGLAELCGKSGASRAVGSAMACNPFSLIVPCHRVIRSDGHIGNYSKCTKNDVKAWLLDHENPGKN